MNIEHCPRCGKESFLSTGAFWSCGSCHIAITTQALAKESRHRQTSTRSRKKK